MSDSDGMSGGIFARVRLLIDKALHLAETRLELLSTELQEEKCRIIEALLWASAGIFLAGIAAVMTTVSVIFVLWENHELRMVALVVFTLFYVFAAMYCFRRLRRKLKDAGTPFLESLREIKKDRECLNTHN